jgi:hypothetical protein
MSTIMFLESVDRLVQNIDNNKIDVNDTNSGVKPLHSDTTSLITLDQNDGRPRGAGVVDIKH